jgi:two-component system nitrogen regulation sensor histidine kinase NtrY
MQWIKKLLDYRLFLLSFVFFSGVVFLLFNSQEKQFNQANFQQKIKQLEAKLNVSADDLLKQSPSFQNPAESAFLIHFFKGDSLVYWNTNKLPVSKFTSIQFPANGINHLQNGWFLTVTKQKENRKIAVSFELKTQYNYENEFLENHTYSGLCDVDFDISLIQQEGYKITDSKGKHLFSVIPKSKQNTENPFLLLWFICGLITLLIGLYQLFSKRFFSLLVFFLGSFVLRILIFPFDFHLLFGNQAFLSAELFGYNLYFSTFLDFCLNFIFGSIAFLSLLQLLNLKKTPLFLQISLIFLGWWLILQSINLVVLNSTIPLTLENLFELNTYSFIVLLVFGFAYYCFQRALILFTKNALSAKIILGYFLFGILFFIGGLGLKGESSLAVLLPLILLAINLFFKEKRDLNKRIMAHILTLLAFTFTLISDLSQHNSEKDKESRILFANELSVEQDVNIELDYTSIKEKIYKEPLLQSIVSNETQTLSISDFGDILEKKYFNGIWDGYEMTFNLSDSSGLDFFTNDYQNYNLTQNLIKKNGIPSSVDASVFFIENSIGGYSYIIREKLTIKGGTYVFIVTLKSKRIPEEIGFPRLLISKNSTFLSSLEKYSISKYAGNKLIKSYGKFHFPTNLKAFPRLEKKATFFDFDDYNHYRLKNGNNTVILSIEKKDWFDFTSAFSFVFCYYAVLLLIINLFSGKTLFDASMLSLSFKIQYAVVLLVIVVLVLFATGSGYFVEKQYQNSTDKVIEEKLNSVEEELRGKIGALKKLTIENNGNILESVLTKLSRVFETDLNIYDENGYLIASSRSKIFNLGLLSEQINPEAFEKIKRDKRSFYSHKENIGKLSYVSSYQPIYNGEQMLLGYVNLQHFGQQQDFEEQLRDFFVAVINVFILLLILSTTIALIVSNWLTAPLKILKERVSKLQLGNNVKIEYSGKDEIGTIVNAYNLKLDELQEAAKQLAKNERESAWREMAKQVAHEIKNPLTPMKLSIQHLMRVYDAEDPNSKEKLLRVLNSIIEQIDGLTRIANEFSNFAKMPEPDKKPNDLIEIIKNTMAIYESEENTTILLNSEADQLILKIDKEQWVQVFNNLIKNAIQATSLQAESRIIISVRKESDAVIIEVSDNGSGIDDEQKEKIFIPYFTTKNTGSGIGLSVVKQIVENHEGEISFVSELNKGTTFRIRL